ncbi:zinc-binding dehydrogenase [Streptomyces sp. LHD-70]|uniref:zinc-binding dehydrogenase n=1 Tax=Streptomyces sp. LHD-70 TaxID=3072140 RepID=UPI0035BE2283
MAVTGDPEARGEALRALGAHEVVGTPAAASEPVHGVVDLVGGKQLVEAYEKLAGGGTLVAVGHAAGDPEHFPYGALFGDEGRHDRTVAAFHLLGCTNLAPDLSWLAQQVAAGELDPGVSWRGSWQRAEEAADALLGRRLHGKAVLDLDAADA